MTARLGRTTSTHRCARRSTPSATAWCAATSPAELYAAPLRLLSAPEQDVVLRELLAAHAESVVGGPPSLRAALGTRGFAERGAGGAGPGPRARARAGRPAWPLGQREGGRSGTAAGLFMEEYLTGPRLPGRARLRRPDPPRRLLARPTTVTSVRRQFRRGLRRRVPGHRPGQVALLQALAGDGRDLVVVGDPDQSHLRLPGRRRARHPRLPDRVPPRRRVTRAGGRPAARRAGSGRGCWRRPGGSPADRPHRGRSTPRRFRRSATPRWRPRARRGPGRGAHLRHRAGARPSTSPTSCAAPTSRTACPGPRSRCWSAPARSRSPRCGGLWWRAGVPVEVAGDEVPLVREPAVQPLLDASGRRSTSTPTTPTSD